MRLKQKHSWVCALYGILLALCLVLACSRPVWAKPVPAGESFLTSVLGKGSSSKAVASTVESTPVIFQDTKGLEFEDTLSAIPKQSKNNHGLGELDSALEVLQHNSPVDPDDPNRIVLLSNYLAKVSQWATKHIRAMESSRKRSIKGRLLGKELDLLAIDDKMLSLLKQLQTANARHKEIFEEQWFLKNHVHTAQKLLIEANTAFNQAQLDLRILEKRQQQIERLIQQPGGEEWPGLKSIADDYEKANEQLRACMEILVQHDGVLRERLSESGFHFTLPNDLVLRGKHDIRYLFQDSTIIHEEAPAQYNTLYHPEHDTMVWGLLPVRHDQHQHSGYDQQPHFGHAQSQNFGYAQQPEVIEVNSYAPDYSGDYDYDSQR